MSQYFDIKQKHPDALLLFRVGDFYETFGEDAIKASQILGIVLTSRNNGGSKIELAGFPYHSVDVYLPKLVRAGYRVAICEQMEKPSKEKKIVRRDVTEVVTPGVTTHDNILNSKENNFLASIIKSNDQYGIAFLDISTGEFLVHSGGLSSIKKLIQSLSPNEILYSKNQGENIKLLLDNDYYTFGLDEWFYEAQYNRDILLKHFKVISLKGYGIEDLPLTQIAAGTILHYLSTVQQSNLSHIKQLVKIESDKYMWLDRFTIRNLELTRSNHPSGISLLDIIDHTSTPMGSRMLNKWLVLPLKTIVEINARLNRVEFLYEDESKREKLKAALKAIGDLERVSSKIPLGKISPREFIVIHRALVQIKAIKEAFKSVELEDFSDIVKRLDNCEKFDKLITDTLTEDAPVALNKGNVIKDGWDEKLDEWRDVSKNGKSLLANLQAKEAEATGISNLKVGFNNVFGYYLEVTNKYKGTELIPDTWTRKQTLKSAERYITPELKELEVKILQAQEQITELEARLYEELVEKANTYVGTLILNSQLLAELDCYVSFAQLAEDRKYVKPLVDNGLTIDIKNGRHPVIETQLNADNAYVPNDVFLDNESQQIIMITGPNMSGKSAVLRQTALITLLSHIGSFVPASSAQIGVTDKIFTRVGASDNISSGESTFMVEMNETSSILNNLSNRSLILLDEIGRGTSTYDGISIAWSIAEYLHENDKLRPKTLFATHYHELNQLAESFDRIKNFHVSTKEIGEEIIFLRKLKEGSSESSFGIHVAQLAGMPDPVLSKAKTLLAQLESNTIADQEHMRDAVKAKQDVVTHQLSIFDSTSEAFKKIANELEVIDIQAMTPIEALLKLKELKDLMSE